jgi:hypothetical protein
MWRRTACIIALGTVLVACRKSSGQTTDDSEPLISHRNWIHFDVSLGRILATSHRTTQNRQQVHREHPCGGCESLAITIDRGLISVQYSLCTDDEQLKVEVVRRDQLRIAWTRRTEDGTPTTTLFDQDVNGDVHLTIRSPRAPEQSYWSPSLWHVMLMHPHVCEDHLVGVLERLRPNWHPGEEAAAIRSALFDPRRHRAAVSRREVQLMVDQLADKRFHVRRQADRQLRNWGRSALCFLDELDSGRLDCEQR